MDIKELVNEKINEIVDKIKKDKDLKEKFSKNPIKTVEELAGVDLPEDQITKVVDAVRAKVALDDVDNVLDDLASTVNEKLGSLGNKLFSKKK